MKIKIGFFVFAFMFTTSAFAEDLEGVIAEISTSRTENKLYVTLESGVQFKVLTNNDYYDPKMIMMIQTAFLAGANVKVKTDHDFAKQITVSKTASQ